MFKKIGTFKDKIDGTIKCVYEEDKKIIEISLLFNKSDRNVVCVPTHHFCSLGCRMCHLTNNCLNKKMEPIQYKDFIFCLLDCLKYFKNIKDNLLISFMGVGEPLLNLELIKQIYLNEKDIKNKYNYKNIFYAVSTMMPNNNVLKLKQMVLQYKIPLKLHFSMHSPIDIKRSYLIPSSKVSNKQALELLLDYQHSFLNDKEIMKKYRIIHKNNPVEIHYTLIDNVNDSDIELNTLYDYLNYYKIQIKFIKFNPINNLIGSKKLDKWINKLSEINNLIIKQYCPPGRQVGSSCGEFTKHYYHEEIESKEDFLNFIKWKEEFEIKE